VTSELLAAVISGIPADFASPDDDAATTRAKMTPLHGHPLGQDTEVRTISAGGVRCGWLSTPASRSDRGTAVFFHGGAFVSCDLEAYLFYAEIIAENLRVPVVTVDYRLAPEYRFPAAVDDCTAAYAGLVTGGLDPGRTVLVGDSCGGGLALATAQATRDLGTGMPAGVVSLSGWTDLDTRGYGPPGPAGPDPFITEGFLRARAGDYLGPGGTAADPRASPSRGSLSGLSPLLLQVGEVDLCRLDAELLGAAARAVGTDARVDVVADGIHGIQGLVNLGVPEALAAWESVARFVDELLGT
jgi:monoterpene epsilon-lactone hydrolase